MNLEKFFNPKSVAVIGASSDPRKVGFALIKNLSGNKNIKIFPVNIEHKEIPDSVDLAIIAIKADLVPQILEDCGQKKISNAIVISSGFKETGETGKELENQILKIAEKNNIALLGPNCLGIIDTRNDLNASFSPQKPLSGRIALLSQSGALGTAMLDWAIGEGVGFSKFISLGNEAQLTEIDFLKYLRDDADTDAVLVYLEKISDGEEFMHLISEITKKKPVVILKAGISEKGAKAVSSHTGSLAPESAVFAGACKQTGVVLVSSLREFFNAAKLLQLGVGMNNPVRNLVILTNGGGPSVVATDLIGNSLSLSLVELNTETKEKLKKVLPTMAAVDNPIDIIGDALAERYERALDILCEISEIDGVIVMLTPQMMTDSGGVAKALAKYKNKKIFPVFMGGPSVEKGREELKKIGLVNFNFPKDVIEALDRFAKEKITPPAPLTTRGESKTLSQMSFVETVKILNNYGIKIAGKFINKKEDLGNALQECGDGPYVMKAISNAAVHKTDAGTVRLNISNFDEAGRVWEELWTNPKVIGNVEGILVQQMMGKPASAEAPAGKEVIIGMKKDATFGPTILFGLGGILTEIIKDTVVRIAPLNKEEALKMMQEIKGIKILQGLRGEPPVNFDLLADIIINLSRLSLDYPEVKEIDLNPVICSDNKAVVVDARAII